MKRLPLFERLRESPAGVLAPADARRPFRLWMTGSLAVVMAAMIPIRDVAEDERASVMRVLRHSRYGVSETLLRIEAAARDQGLPVLALMRGAQPVLVLASSIGGTPIVMLEADSQPAMPLSLMVRGNRRGGADVLVASGASGWQDLPAAVADEMAALPALVDRALV